ncbi:MAG: hypothetical protein LBQ22_08050 [Bacteroidales bacterium]|nr:hypothetical protein [Bacteroidales bacterium]
MASGSGWGLWKMDEESNNYYKVESFGGRSWDRIRALEAMFKLNGWNIPVGGLR